MAHVHGRRINRIWGCCSVHANGTSSFCIRFLRGDEMHRANCTTQPTPLQCRILSMQGLLPASVSAQGQFAMQACALRSVEGHPRRCMLIVRCSCGACVDVRVCGVMWHVPRGGRRTFDLLPRPRTSSSRGFRLGAVRHGSRGGMSLSVCVRLWAGGACHV